MPKIIDQVENKIVEATRRQIFNEGNFDFSLRTIANECGIAVSTIYNYFKNKEKLIESILLDDWFVALYKIDVGIENITHIEEGFSIICTSIRSFTETYKDVWQLFHGSIYAIPARHHLVLDQIKIRVERILDKFGYGQDKQMSTVLSECILVCATQIDVNESEFKYHINRLFNK